MKLLTLGQGRTARWLVVQNLRPQRFKALEQLVRTMKLTCVFLTVAFLHVSAGSYSQQVTLSLKDAPIEKVFREIERQTGYGFLYNKKMFADFPKVTIEVKDADITEVLNRCFRSAAVDYVINSQTIVIREKTQPEKETQSAATPPPGDIHGSVVDSLGNPLVGASVVVKGAKKGTQTDGKGNFELKGVDNNASLLISLVGFGSQEIKLAGRQEIRVTLKQSMSQLDETVVKGYYTTTERLNTGDVTTVKGETINEQPVSDPILALEGRVPGLNIQQASGIAGAYSTITIRGVNSIANGNDPLYIVDGVPYSSSTLTSTFIGGGALGLPAPGSNVIGSIGGGQGMSPFNNLNPADIESIEVLKDADATAIYGSRGANGVILINTKKGKAGRTQFDLNAFSGAGKVTRMLHLLNTPQYLEMRNEGFGNDGFTPGPTDYDVNGVWDTTRYTNWQKALIGHSAPFTDVEGNLSGGNANTQFLMGGGFSNQGTVYPGNYSDQKISAHLNLTHASTDQRLHVQLSASYVNDNSNLPPLDLTGSTTLAPDAPALYNSDGSLNWQPENGTETWNNPLSNTLCNAKANTDNLISNLNLSYLLLPGLQLKGNFGYSHSQMNQAILTPATAYGPPYVNPDAERTNSSATTDFKTWIIEPQINYQRRIAQGQLEVLAGSTFQQNTQNAGGEIYSGFTSDALLSDPLAASSRSLYGYSNILYHYEALFGRINYNWREKYLLNITARRDGSSRFGPGRQFGNFGAVGAGWIFSRERFIQDNLPFLSFGKLRASYGTTGNDQIPDYQFLSTYTPYSPTYEGITGLYPTSLANPYFGWELVKKIEGGVELGFLKDRILLTASYYRDRTGNQLVGYSLPQLTGFGSVQANLPAVVQNSGGEFVLNTINIKSRNFTWSSAINLTIPRNKLLSYPGLASSAYALSYVVGQSLFIKKLFNNTGVNPGTGVYSYATKNASGEPSYPQDLQDTKPVTQSWYGGIQNSFTFKGFQLDIFFQFVKQLGVNDRRYFLNYLPGYFNLNQPTYVLARWQKPGDLTNIGKFSTEYAADPAGDITASDFIVSDASFIRLKNLRLSYTLPGNWQQKVHLHNVRVYLQCQNLLTITKYLGPDPETQGLSLPPLRMITGGIQVSL
jgi:TonB-dependent starch-binding outer membrane protein SusC